jgi:hypothetical protein
MPRSLALSLAFAATLAGCATGGRSRAGSEEPEFVGRSMEVVTANNQATVLHFSRDGAVTARFAERETEGRWNLQPRELCFTWRETFRECWPYTEPFREGRQVSIRSDRGNTVLVTLR